MTLKNLGSTGQGVTATLEPTDWYAGVTRAQASFADIFAGSQKESRSPYFAVSTAPGTPAGHKAGFAVHWRTSTASGTSVPFFIPVGARTCTTVGSTNVPRPVLDRATATSTLSFPGDMEIDEVNVYADVTHPYKGDLVVSIVSPSGSPVILHDHSGGSGDNVMGWFDTNLGTFEMLSRFEGEHSSGTWTLRILDSVPANTGTLNSWQLQVCGRPFEASTPEMKLRAASRSGDHGIFEWWPYPGLASYRVYRATSPSSAASFVNVTAEDPVVTDTLFEDSSTDPVVFFLVTGVGPQGEGAWGHFGR